MCIVVNHLHGFKVFGVHKSGCEKASYDFSPSLNPYHFTSAAGSVLLILDFLRREDGFGALL